MSSTALPAERAKAPTCRLLFCIGALKQSDAKRVTAVVPSLCYSRKDRQTKLRDPVTTRYVAQLFEAVGTDQVVTMEARNVAAFQNAFRCGTVHLNRLRSSFLIFQLASRSPLSRWCQILAAQNARSCLGNASRRCSEVLLPRVDGQAAQYGARPWRAVRR